MLVSHSLRVCPLSSALALRPALGSHFHGVCLTVSFPFSPLGSRVLIEILSRRHLMVHSLINSHSNHDINYNYRNTRRYSCNVSGAELEILLFIRPHGSALCLSSWLEESCFGAYPPGSPPWPVLSLLQWTFDLWSLGPHPPVCNACYLRIAQKPITRSNIACCSGLSYADS